MKAAAGLLALALLLSGCAALSSAGRTAPAPAAQRGGDTEAGGGSGM